jgi:signal transduction histidine kinase
MAVGSSSRQSAKRAGSNSINFHFTADLIAPVICLIAAWGALAAVVLSGALDRLHWLGSATPDHGAVVGAAILAGTGPVIVLVAALLMGRFARRVRREAETLIATSQRSADEQAAAAEAAEAALGNGFRQILASLGRRNQSLLHRQLRIIDTLEQQASSPAALAELFTLDHLTTRMRRHAESLTVLSGAAPGRSWSGPVPIIDVMRAAAAEVEDYTRVTVISDAEEAVAAAAVTDMIHLLAELVENATLFSPSSTRVEVRAERVANGFAVEVTDRGLGIPPDQLRELNAQLAEPPDVGLADADRLGLFVAGRLAARHGVHVSLSPSPYLGTKAVVVLPDTIVVPETGDQGISPERPRNDSARLNLRAPHLLSLTDPGGQEQGAADGGGPADARMATQAPTTVNGLPQRVRADRQTGDDGAGRPAHTEGSAPRHALVEAPTPDDARSLAASLQSSWHRSRHGQFPAPPLATRAGRADDANADDANYQEG